MIITRRRFLQGVGATGVLAAVGCKPLAGQQVPPIPIPARPILVVVDIDGGNDWLNMMPPLSGNNRSVYQTKRPTLAVPPEQTIGLENGAGLNADFVGMAELDALGRVAWLPGIGMNNPNLSHFVSIDLWGQGAAQPSGTGWLGRFADRAFDTSGDVLRGLTVTSDRPLMLRGASRSFVSITSANGFVYPSWLRGALRSAAPRGRFRRRRDVRHRGPGLRPRLRRGSRVREALPRRAEWLRHERKPAGASSLRALPR